MDGHSGHDAGKWPQNTPAPVYARQEATAWRGIGRGRGRWCSCTRARAPALPGVYALFHRQQIMYIGSTDQLARRLRHHRSRGTAHDEARFSVETRPGFWLAREYRLLARLRPQLNTRLPKHRR